MNRKCPICSCKNHTDIEGLNSSECGTSHLKKEYYLTTCDNCGLVFYRTAPSKTEMFKMYESDYREKGYDKKDSVKFSWNQKIILWYSLLKPYLSTTKSILDIGCAEGCWLEFLRNKGHIVSGVELNNESIAILDNKKIPVYKNDILEIEEDKKFDIIFMSGYLEHTYEPTLVLEKCNRMLNDNGIIYIQVPDLNCPNQIDINDFFPIEHLQVFGQADLVNVLINTNFDPVFYKDDVLNFGHCIIAKKGTHLKGIVKSNNYQRVIELIEEHRKIARKENFSPISNMLTVITNPIVNAKGSSLLNIILNGLNKIDKDKLYIVKKTVEMIIEKELE